MSERIGIIGATYSGNKGSAGMLIAAVDSIRNQLPGAEFKIFSLYPTGDERAKQTDVDIISLRVGAIVFILPLVSFLYLILGWIKPVGSLLRRYIPLNELVQADILLDLSGISFVDGRTATLVYNICCILPAFFVRTPVIKMSQALGPFNRLVNKISAKILLQKVRTIYSRGILTSQNLRKLGLTNWKSAADLAFLLKTDLVSIQINELLPKKQTLTIGVSPSQVFNTFCLKAGVNYIEHLASALNSVAEANNARIVIIAHSNLGENTVSRNNDYHICSQLYKLCCKEHTTLILQDLSPGELRWFIGNCDVFIASRFHSMISAICTGTPVLVTAWSHKYLEVMREFDSGNWILGIEDISEPGLTNMLNQLILNRKAVSETITRNLSDAKASAQKQIDDVVQILSAGAR